MKQYLNLIVALVVTTAPSLVVALADGHVTQQEDVGLAIAFLTPALIYVAPNLPDSAYVKPVVAGLLALAQAVAQVIPAGGFGAITFSQWIMVVVAVAGAFGIVAFPNAPQPAIRSAAQNS